MPRAFATKWSVAHGDSYKTSVVKNDITCAACCTDFKRLSRELNKIEKYLGVVCCPSCGYPNLYIEEKVVGSKCKVAYAKEYSIGYEVEFFIPKAAQEYTYDSFISVGLSEGFGHDGAGKDIKEYRSPVFVGYSATEAVEMLLDDLNAVVDNIHSYGGKLSPARFQCGAFRTFGIHISFGNGFLDVGSSRFSVNHSRRFKFIMSIFRKLGTRSVLRLSVGAYRGHQSRVEIRLLDSSEKNVAAMRNILYSVAQMYER